MKHSLKILLFLLLLGVNSLAQDVQFSQYYNASLYLNPAFAGSLHKPRGMIHQRLQWPRLDAKYITSLASFDTYFGKYRSGLGIMVMQDYQGSGILNTTSLAFQYSYEIHLNKKFSIRPGLEMGFVSKKINYDKLLFPSQFNGNGFNNTHLYSNANENAYYPDISAGGIFYSKEMWFGFSAHHLNTPNQSMLNNLSQLPTKFTFVTGYKIVMKKSEYMGFREEERDISITPTVHYKFQGKSDQLDVGIYGIYDKVLFGFWYRGIPVKQYEKKLHNNESFITMIGGKIKRISVTYSYDWTVSKLTTARTGGSHELNITYVYKKNNAIKVKKRLPCPNFL